MKKSLIALAVMAAAGAASAQSSVTLFGIVDATLQWSKSSGEPNGDTRFRVTNSGYNSSRLGFRGTEDLGGGMSASFWLEAGINNDDGTGTSAAGGLQFNRRSTVSLAGNWGEVRIGRDYTPQFWNLTVFDPFGTNGAGTTVTTAANLSTRLNNTIGYFLPRNLGGFYGQVMYGENELANTSALVDSGTHFGARFGYAAGPFNVAVGFGRSQDMVAGATFVGDRDAWNVGGQWDFGVAKLMGQYAQLEDDSAEVKSWLIGALMPVGAGEIRASFSQAKTEVAGADPKVRRFAVGYVHNLSKRTAVYTTFAHTRADNSMAAPAGMIGLYNSANGGATGAGGKTNVIDFGVRHSF